jgi:hypothetical protein
VSIALGLWCVPLSAAEIKPLPATAPLDWEGEPADRMMDGLHRYIEGKIAESIGRRERLWKRDFSSPEAYAKSVEPNRERLKKILGVVDSRVAVRMERFGDDDRPALVAKTDRYGVYQVRWPVLEGVSGEGLLLEPSGKPLAQVVALPDADQTPEQLAGLAPGIPAASQFARRLADAGFRVVVPVLIDRSDEWSGHPDVRWTNQPHREWVYRQAYMMGRHVIGYEVQKVLAAVDWLKHTGPGLKVGVIGYGEGGLVAMDAAAVDSRIDACRAGPAVQAVSLGRGARQAGRPGTAAEPTIAEGLRSREMDRLRGGARCAARHFRLGHSAVAQGPAAR